MTSHASRRPDAPAGGTKFGATFLNGSRAILGRPATGTISGSAWRWRGRCFATGIPLQGASLTFQEGSAQPFFRPGTAFANPASNDLVAFALLQRRTSLTQTGRKLPINDLNSAPETSGTPTLGS